MRPKNKCVTVSIVLFSVIILDQLSKLAVRSSIKPGESLSLGFFSVTLVHNTGAGFGIMKEWTQALIWLSIAVIGFFIYFYDVIPEKGLVKVFAALILAGTLGNLIDRLAYGYVVDFINVGFWPVFNIADSALTIGAFGLAALFLKPRLTKA